MTVAQNIESACSARPAGRPCAWLLVVGLLAGCWGGSGIDPKLEAQQRKTSRQTISTADFPIEEEPAEEPADEAAAEADADDSEPAMGDPTPAPLDNPQPAEPAPASQHPPYADDSVYCGNGVLDDDELCDVAIDEGEPGACPLRCSDDPCAPEVLEIRSCWSVCVPAEVMPGACS